MKRTRIALLAALTICLAGCGENTTGNSSATVAGTNSEIPGNKPAAITEKYQTLLFFMNPHGKPCQIQDNILKSLGERLASHNVRIEYVKTTEMASARRAFQKYGVRALPQIIALDADGMVKKRFSPGIQNQFALMAAFE